MIPKAGFAFFLATCGVAFAVSGTKAAPSRAKGLALFEQGDCRGAVPELLRALSEGDSSHVLVLNLAQALECDGRTVDALSATYVDAKADTTGRIDVLLYRAHLLRKFGLDDEAEKVEREAGLDIGASLGTRPEDMEESSWSWAPSISGGFGWMSQYDKISIADSLRWIASQVRVKADSARNVVQPKARTDDSVHILGKQIPLDASIGVGIGWDAYYLWMGVPAQATLKTDLSDWLSTSARVLVQAGGQWTNRWFETSATGSAERSWTWYPGYQPLRSTGLSGSLQMKKSVPKSTILLTNAGSLELDSSNTFKGFTGSHTIGFVRSLPLKIDLSLGAGYTWYVDKPRDEFVHLAGFRVIIPNVEGIEVGMENQDTTTLKFLDSNGVVIPRSGKTIFDGKLYSGYLPQQRSQVRDGYDYPNESRMDWRKWNGGVQFSKNFPLGVVAKVGCDLSRTELVHPQRVTFVPKDSLYTARLSNTNDLVLYRDVRTGIEYWVGEPAKGSYVGPIFFEKHRVDFATTFSASLSWSLWQPVSASLGWYWVRNRSNLASFVEGSSYTRSLWNASATVSW